VRWDIGAQAQRWANGAVNNGLTITSSDETNSFGWRRFANGTSGGTAPSLVIIYGTNNCTYYPQTGHSVCGAIRDHYNALGGPNGFLGYPTSDEITNPDGVGKRNTFQNGGDYIYWSPATGAAEIGGAIVAHWGNYGYETGPLGYPTSDELGTPNGAGRYNVFQNVNDHIYWTPATGAQEIGGSIFTHWGDYGFEAGRLGFPTTDETGTPDGFGRFNHFQSSNGSIYYSPATGTHEIEGAIAAHWAQLGYETGILGYPTTDEIANPDNRGAHNLFSKSGGMWWSPTTGAHQVSGSILALWGQRGYEASLAGYPTTDEIDNTGPAAMFPEKGSRRNDFEAGIVFGGSGPAYFGSWWGMTKDANGNMTVVSPTMSPYQMANGSNPAAGPAATSASAQGVSVASSGPGTGEGCPDGTTNYPSDQYAPNGRPLSVYNCVAVYQTGPPQNYDNGVRKGFQSLTQGIRDTSDDASKGFGITHADKDHNVTLHDIGILTQGGFPSDLQTEKPEQNRYITTAYFGDSQGPTALTSISMVIQRYEDLEGNAPDTDDMGLITAYCNAGMIGPQGYEGFCPDNLPTAFAVGGRNQHGQGEG